MPQRPLDTFAKLYQRPLPYSLEAEMALLGSLILDPATALDATRTLAGAGDFYSKAHATIYRALLDLYARDPAADLVGLLDVLRGRGQLDGIGGPDYLSKLAAETPSAAGAGRYAKTVAQNARLRKLIEVADCTIYDAMHADAHDADTVIQGAAAGVARIARAASARVPTTIKDAEQAVLDELDNGRPALQPTGLPFFDCLGDGVPQAGVWTIMGYPGGSKTTFALNATINMAAGVAGRSPVPVRVCSFEQDAFRIAATLLGSHARVPVHRFLNRGEAPSPEQRDSLSHAFQTHAGLDFAMFEDNLTPIEIYTETAALAAKHPRGVVVVDYLQDIPPFGAFQEITPRIAEGLRILARIARELGWLVVAVSQLDKAAGKANRRPVLTDGLGSSAIEQRSDLISYVYRPHQREVHPQTVETPDDRSWQAWHSRQGRVEVGIIKNKFGGLGVNDAVFVREHLRFRATEPGERAHWPAIEE